MDLKGKVALVTGGTAGIGLAVAGRLRERGAKAIVCGMREHGAPELDLDGMVFGDVTDPCDRARIVTAVISKFGRVDVLVNSAGVGLYAPASDSPPDLVRRMFDVNVFAALEMVALVRPHMRASGGGTIVNIGSIGGVVTLPWSTMYCASKSALHSMSNGLYRELRNESIHVMLVVPGIVRTSFRERVLGGTVPEGVGRIRYLISPADLAAAIVLGIERKRRKIVKPWPGFVFAAVDHLFPAVIDWYCGRKLACGFAEKTKSGAPSCDAKEPIEVAKHEKTGYRRVPRRVA